MILTSFKIFPDYLGIAVWNGDDGNGKKMGGTNPSMENYMLFT